MEANGMDGIGDLICPVELLDCETEKKGKKNSMGPDQCERGESNPW
jgi:hypothetical protein